MDFAVIEGVASRSVLLYVRTRGPRRDIGREPSLRSKGLGGKARN